MEQYQEKCLTNLLVFSNHHPLSEKHILQDLGNALLEYEKYKSVDRSSCFSTSLPTPTLRRQMSPRKNIKTSGYIRSLLRWFLIRLSVFCATGKTHFEDKFLQFSPGMRQLELARGGCKIMQNLLPQEPEAHICGKGQDCILRWIWM